MIEIIKKGEDVFIHDTAIIKRPHLVSIGNHVSIDCFVYISTRMALGNYIHISPHVSCVGGEKGLFFARGFNNIMAGVRIICGSDRFDDSGLFGAMIPEELKGSQIIKPIVMEEFSNVGSNAIILPGSILRRGVLLSAGSMLVGDTEEWGVYKGSPAVLVKKIDGTKIIELAKQLGYE
jgi:galactoside O-acetyltransferase